MTVLASKAIRDALNIDTFERGLVYSALLLRASNTLNAPVNSDLENTYTNAVQLVTDLIDIGDGSFLSTISIHGKFPYDNQVALKNGGNFLISLKVFSNGNPNPFLFNCNPTANNVLPIPSEPAIVNTLEKYFVWCAQNLSIGLLLKDPPNTQTVTFNFLEEDADGPSVDIEAVIPYDLKTFYLESNLMNAIQTLITDNGQTQLKSLIGNTISVGNEMPMGNT